MCRGPATGATCGARAGGPSCGRPNSGRFMAFHRLHKIPKPAIARVHPRKAGNSAVLREARVMNTKKMLMTAAALALTGLSTAGMADEGLAYGRSQAPAPLEGTWVVTIQPIVCSSGIDVPGVPSVRAYLTFAPGGTMTETNSNMAFEPDSGGPAMATGAEPAGPRTSLRSRLSSSSTASCRRSATSGDTSVSTRRSNCTRTTNSPPAAP